MTKSEEHTLLLLRTQDWSSASTLGSSQLPANSIPEDPMPPRAPVPPNTHPHTDTRAYTELKIRSNPLKIQIQIYTFININHIKKSMLRSYCLYYWQLQG